MCHILQSQHSNTSDIESGIHVSFELFISMIPTQWIGAMSRLCVEHSNIPSSYKQMHQYHCIVNKFGLSDPNPEDSCTFPTLSNLSTLVTFKNHNETGSNIHQSTINSIYKDCSTQEKALDSYSNCILLNISDDNMTSKEELSRSDNTILEYDVQMNLAYNIKAHPNYAPFIQAADINSELGLLGLASHLNLLPTYT